MLFEEGTFDVTQVLRYFTVKQDGDLAMCYELDEKTSTHNRGIIEVDEKTNVSVHFMNFTHKDWPRTLHPLMFET